MIAEMIGIAATSVVLLLAMTAGAILWLTRRQLAGPTPLRGHPHRLRHPPADEERKVDRRKDPRRWGSPVMVQVSDSLTSTGSVEGVVLNRSAGGLCLSLPRAVEVGKTLNIRVAMAPSSIPWTPVEVKYCSPLAARWKVGCRFTQSLAEDVRHLFG